MNPKTGEPYGKPPKAYTEWLAAQTRQIVSPRDFGLFAKLQKSVWPPQGALALLGDYAPPGA